MNDNIEEWKSIFGFEGYEISSFGRVRSYWRQAKDFGAKREKGGFFIDRLPQTYLRQGLTPNGYPQVVLGGSLSGRKTKQIHKLVARAFLGPCPPGKQVCHNDSNKKNNRASNLRYDTQSGNLADRNKAGTNIVGERNGNSKLTADEVLEIRIRHQEGEPYSTLASYYRIDKATVGKIVNRKIWGHI